MTEATQSEPTGRRGPRQWLSDLSNGVKAVAGLAGAIATILGLVFLFFPDWLPERTFDTGSATLAKPTLEQPVSYRQYLARVEIPPDGYTDVQLARPGVFAGVQVTITGYRGRALPLRWYVLDETTRDIVDQQSRRHTLTADRNEAPVVWPFWVELPRGVGPYTLVIQIYPPSAKPGATGVLPLAETKSDPFPGAPD